MKPANVLRAILYPLTSTSVLVPLVVFWLLAWPASSARMLGLWLGLIVLVALVRFLVKVLEARARGKEPEPPGIEFFSLVSDSWNLFPVLLVLLFAWLIASAGSAFGAVGATAMSAIAAIVFPASLAVLVVTRSPLQSVNPVAILRLLGRCGGTLWIAVVFFVLSGWLSSISSALPSLLANFVQMYLWFAYASLLGTLIEPYDLFDEVGIAAPREKSADMLSEDIEKNRINVLGHAYGFISRDNREGGFRHIFAEIDKDPNPAQAWGWYFGKMLDWEEQQHALFFAQHYVGDALRHGEDVVALKIIMRCRLLDEHFKPASEDLPAAIEAAERHGNTELATVLKRM